MIRQYALCSLLLLAFPLCMYATETPKTEHALTILFTNNTNGEHDTCGCILNQRGGVGRRHTMVQYVRGLPPDDNQLLEELTRARTFLGDRRNVLLLDSGDVYFKTLDVPTYLRDQWQFRAELLVESYNMMAYDVVNIGAYDLALGFDFLKRLQEEANFHFISANIIDRKTDKPMFKPYVRMRKGGITVGIFGLVSGYMSLRDLPGPGNQKAKILDPFDVAEEMVRQLRPRCDVIIALTNMGLRDEEILAEKVPGIDFVIGGHGDPRAQSAPPTYKPFKAGRTLVLQTGEGGKLIGMLTLVIRNGSLDFSDASEEYELSRIQKLNEDLRQRIKEGGDKLQPGAEELLRTAERRAEAYIAERERRSKLVREGDQSFFFFQLPPVEKSIEPNQDIEEKIISFKDRVAKLHKRIASVIPPRDNSYRGAKFCATCHQKQYDAWVNTRHAMAYDALVEVKQEYNPECIECHTTGFRRKNGFVRVTDAGSLKAASVQCEACHGRGREEHFSADNPAPTESFDCLTCTRCHTKDQSPDFDCTKARHEVCAKN